MIPICVSLAVSVILNERVHMTGLLDEVRASVSLPDPATRMSIRRRANVSRERMAAELRVHAISIARWERGTRNPHGELRVRYARLLEQLHEIATVAERGAEVAS
jgi:DNA-binding transcriptional regulator YiaG